MDIIVFEMLSLKIWRLASHLSLV